MTVRTLTPEDLDAAAGLLARAFEGDPGFRRIVPGESDWQRIALPWFRAAIDDARASGQALVDAQLRSISLWEGPRDRRQPAPANLLQLFKLGLILRRHLARALSIQRHTERYRPRRRHWYLTYIASDPAVRRHGLAGKVMTPVLDHASDMRLPVYLECSSRDNVGFYLRHGFNLVAEVPLQDGGTVWPMLREPR